MRYYVIRHKKTGDLMPEVKTRGGYSHWNPNNPNMPKIFWGVPRLLDTRRRAAKCIIQWFVNQNGRRHFAQSYGGEYDEIIDFKPDGRKKDDLEIIEVDIILREIHE